MTTVSGVSVGGVHLRFTASELALPLLERFRDFPFVPHESDQAAIDVELALHAPTPDDVPTDGARFSLAENASELVLTGDASRATISLDNRHAHLAGAAHPQPVHALVRLLLARALLERDTLLLHASAVVPHAVSPGAAIFVGASGAGKTTIVNTLARALPYTIAADEAVVAAHADNVVHISGTPWWQGTAVTAPLRTLLFIERGATRSWRTVARSQAAALLFNAAGPLPASAAERALAVAARIVERAPLVARVMLSSRADILEWLAPRLHDDRAPAHADAGDS